MQIVAFKKDNVWMSCENETLLFWEILLVSQLFSKPLLPHSPPAPQRVFTSLVDSAPTSAVDWRQSVLVHLDATKSQCVSSDHEAAVGLGPMATWWVSTPPCRVKLVSEATYGGIKKNGWGNYLNEYYRKLFENKMPTKWHLTLECSRDMGP